MLTLDKAVAKVIEQAQERCKRCQREAEFKRMGKWARFVGSYSDTPPDNPDHTCHATIAAVRDVALAVWYATIQPPSNAWSMSQVPKKIERLLGPATSK
jgi:hypothetical protein